MAFTALYRSLGTPPGPLTNDLLNAAVSNGVTETSDLDLKEQLLLAQGISRKDSPKDVAAMANSGSGLLVFGIRQAQKAAIERVGVGEFNEVNERSLRSATITAISPAGIRMRRTSSGRSGQPSCGSGGSIQRGWTAPDLSQRLLRRPIRNDSDTGWMKERQIEALYRSRFEKRRHATEALDHLFKEAAALVSRRSQIGHP